MGVAKNPVPLFQRESANWGRTEIRESPLPLKNVLLPVGKLNLLFPVPSLSAFGCFLSSFLFKILFIPVNLVNLCLIEGEAEQQQKQKDFS